MNATDRSLLTERALLTLLLVVGAGALASGLYQVLANPTPPPAGVFDAVLGAAVLLMTWLFLAPYVAPHAFGDLAPGEALMSRPYLSRPIAPATPEASPPPLFARDPRPLKAETRPLKIQPEPEPWRESQTIPRSHEEAKQPMRAPFADEEPAQKASATPRPIQKPAIPDAAPSGAPAPALTTQDALKELDSIVEEFREVEPTPGEPSSKSKSGPPKSSEGKKRPSSTPA